MLPPNEFVDAVQAAGALSACRTTLDDAGTPGRASRAVAADLRNALTPVVAYFDTLDMVPIDDIREGIGRIKAIADALGGPVKP